MLTAQYAAVRARVNDLLDCIPLLVRNLEHSQRSTSRWSGPCSTGRGGGPRADARALRGDGRAAARVPGVTGPMAHAPVRVIRDP